MSRNRESQWRRPLLILILLFFLPSSLALVAQEQKTGEGLAHARNTIWARQSIVLNFTMNNDTRATEQQTYDEVKIVTGIVAGFSALFAAATLYMLVSLSPQLSNGLMIPREYLEKAVDSILFDDKVEPGLPESSIPCLDDNQPGKWDKDDPSSLPVMFEMTEAFCEDDGDNGKHVACHHIPSESVASQKDVYKARGFLTAGNWRCKGAARPDSVSAIDSSIGVWVNAASPAMKSLIQAGIWEFVSMVLAIVMVFSTSFYNYVSLGQPEQRSEGLLRLGLVMSYAFVNIIHSQACLRLLAKTIDNVATQALWVVLSNVFVFVDRRQWHLSAKNDQMPLVARQIQCELLGETKLVHTFHEEKKNPIFPCAPGDAEAWYLRHTPGESTAAKSVKSAREIEIKNLEKAADSALEKTLANVVVLLGIILSTFITSLSPAFANSGQSTAANLGSYALLAALGTGAAALTSSVASWSNAPDSTLVLLQLQSYLIRLSADEHVDQKGSKVDFSGPWACGIGHGPGPKNQLYALMARNTWDMATSTTAVVRAMLHPSPKSGMRKD